MISNSPQRRQLRSSCRVTLLVPALVVPLPDKWLECHIHYCQPFSSCAINSNDNNNKEYVVNEI